jgi:hypothetical protein
LSLTLPAFGVLLVWVAVLFLPGAAVAVAAGLRPWSAVAAAPLLTYGLATATGTVATVVDLTWGPWSMAAAAAAASALLVVLRAPRTQPGRGAGRLRPQAWSRRPSVRDVALGGGVLSGGLLSMGVLLAAFGGIDRPHQEWDYTFHANATRFIADTGQVAPSALRAVNDWESSTFFYPNAFHAVAAVVRDLTGAPVFEVLNTGTLLICAVAGLGLAVLLREVGAPTAVAAATPVLLTCFAAFPYDVVFRGPQLPYAMGVALVPAFLCVVLRMARTPRISSVSAAALGGAALFGVHPSTALAGGLFAAVMLVGRRGARTSGLVALALAGVLTALLAAPMVWGSVRTSTGGPAVDWTAAESPLRAVVQAFTLDEARRGPQLCLAAVTLIGLLTLRSARYLWWLIAATAVPLVLYVLAASSDSVLTAALTRPWWNDRWRFSAWAVLGLAPLAAHGTRRSAQVLSAAVRRLRPTSAPNGPRVRRPVTLAAVLTLAVLCGLELLYVGSNSRRVATAYQSDRHLNAAETAAMAWLAPRVEDGEMVMNDPGDGSAYMSAVAGVRPVFGHQITPSTLGPVQTALRERFRCLDTDRAVRDAIDQLRIHYVFLGTGYVRRSMHRTAGLVDLAASPSVRLVYSHDDVQIYAVTLLPVAAEPLPGCQPDGRGPLG